MSDPRLKRHPLGFLEVVDRPTQEDLAAYYAEKYYQSEQGNYRSSYGEVELDVIRMRVALRAARAEALLAAPGPARLLDVGCGEGFVLADFAARGWDVAGMDFSIAGVRAMNPAMARHVEQGDVFELLDAAIASERKYELVWLGHVLEHVLEPLALLRALRRLVAEGGVLVATVPNDGSRLHERLLADGDIDRRFWIAPPDHMSYFTADSLRAAADATGWTAAEILGDFPIDMFLAHPGSNYVADPSQGKHAHAARLKLEALIGEAGLAAANRFYAALADVGLGRNLTAFLTPAAAGGEGS